MKHLRWMIALSLASAGLGAAGGVFAAKSKEIVVTPDSEVKFQPLDPTDTEGKGTQISVVFGDLKKKGPVGYLLKVPAGATSPAHTHTSDDYAVVVKGAMSNHPPGAESKLLSPGERLRLRAGQHRDGEDERREKVATGIVRQVNATFARDPAR
jgi:quercetin dioxygenase-like cupin family protein